MHFLGDGVRAHDKDILAYLSLPSKAIFGTTATASFHSPMVVDASVKKDLSKKQKVAFKRAKKVLSLTPSTEDVQLAYMFPAEAYRYSKKNGWGELKALTKRALRNAYQEKQVDADGKWIGHSMSNAS